MRVADETGDELPAATFAHDEKFDLFVLCGLARTDSHRSRVLEPDSDQTKALRALRKGLPFQPGRLGHVARASYHPRR